MDKLFKLVFAIFFVGTAQAQIFHEEFTGPTKTESKVKCGVYANISSGFTYGSFGKLENDLKSTNTYGSDFFIKGLGSMWGGSVHGLIAKRFLISGNAAKFSYDASVDPKAQKGQSKLKSTVFGGNVGFVVANKNKSIWYPYLGYSMGTSKLNLQNYEKNDITFGGNDTILRISENEYTSKVGTFELGFGFRHFFKETGGLTVGIDLGGYFGSSKPWEGESVTVSGIGKPGLTGGYLRFSFGGSFFKLQDGNSISGSSDGEVVKPKKEKKSKKETSGSEPK